MRAIVLAAGQGTRLRPLTDDVPKCLVPLAGSRLLDRQLRVLREEGIEDITIVTGYAAGAVDAPGCRLLRNPEFERTNMVSTLFCARSAMNDDDDLLIAYSDIVYEPRVVRAVLECDAPICLPIDTLWRRLWEVRMDDPLADAETLRLDGDGRVLELGKKPSSIASIQGQYIGMFKLDRSRIGDFQREYDSMDRDATYDGKNFSNMYMTSFLQHLIDRGWNIRSVPVRNGWLEVDTIQDLRTYESMHHDGTLTPICDLDRCGTADPTARD